MNLLEFEQLMTGANMPRCLQRGALFDSARGSEIVLPAELDQRLSLALSRQRWCLSLVILLSSPIYGTVMSKYSWVLALFLVLAAAFACGCAEKEGEVKGAAEAGAEEVEGAAAEVEAAVEGEGEH